MQKKQKQSKGPKVQRPSFGPCVCIPLRGSRQKLLAASSSSFRNPLPGVILVVMAPKGNLKKEKVPTVPPDTASATTEAAVGAPTQATVGAEIGDAPRALLEAKPWADLGVESGFLTDDVPCEDYVMCVAASVRSELMKVLSLPPAGGGIGLEGSLNIQAPLKVAETLKGMDSYKEHWRWSNCKKVA